jgi:hypothetical protein
MTTPCLCLTRACSQREAAVSLSLHSSVNGGCLPWLTLGVSGFTMRSYYFIGVIALLLQGCGRPQPSADQANEKSMVGTWTFPFPDGDPNIHVKLRANGHWDWWSHTSPKFPPGALQAGRWFIHDGTLFCRIEESRFRDFPPGMAFTFDLKSVSAETALLTWLDGKREVKWTRVR